MGNTDNQPLEGESDVANLFKQRLEQSENLNHQKQLKETNNQSISNTETESNVDQVLKQVNHQTGMKDLLGLFMAGSFTFLVALIAPFCVKKTTDETKNNK